MANDPGTPKKLVVVAGVHHISWDTARAGPFKHVGSLMGTVDVVVVVAVIHHIPWAAVRPARENIWAASWAGRSGPNRTHLSWAAACPGPSKFQRIGRGPAQPIIFSNFHSPARPDPSHF